MSESTQPDDGIDITELQPGQAPVYYPDTDGPKTEVTVHGAAAGDAGPMLFQVDVYGHGFYIYGLAGIDETGPRDRFVVVPDSQISNTHAEAAIEAMGGVVRDE